MEGAHVHEDNDSMSLVCFGGLLTRETLKSRVERGGSTSAPYCWKLVLLPLVEKGLSQSAPGELR